MENEDLAHLFILCHLIFTSLFSPSSQYLTIIIKLLLLFFLLISNQGRRVFKITIQKKWDSLPERETDIYFLFEGPNF